MKMSTANLILEDFIREYADRRAQELRIMWQDENINAREKMWILSGILHDSLNRQRLAKEKGGPK